MAYSDTFYHLCCLLRICDIVRLSWVRVSSFWDWIGTPLVEPSLKILGAEGSLMINHRHNLNYTYKKNRCQPLELSRVTDLHLHFEDYDPVKTLIHFSIVQMGLQYPQPIRAIVLVQLHLLLKHKTVAGRIEASQYKGF